MNKAELDLLLEKANGECAACKGKPTEELGEAEEQELIEKIIGLLKEYKLTYSDAHGILNCVGTRLRIMSQFLHL